MLTIVKGSKSPETAIAIAAGHNYTNAKLVAEYQSARREFTNLAAGQIVRVAFSSQETGRFALGTYPMRVALVDADGVETDIGGTSVRIRVTDDPNEVTNGVVLVLSTPGADGGGSTGLAGVEGLPEQFTDNQLRAKLNEVIGKLGGTVTAIALALLLPLAATAASARELKERLSELAVLNCVCKNKFFFGKCNSCFPVFFICRTVFKLSHNKSLFLSKTYICAVTATCTIKR